MDAQAKQSIGFEGMLDRKRVNRNWLRISYRADLDGLQVPVSDRAGACRLRLPDYTHRQSDKEAILTRLKIAD